MWNSPSSGWSASKFPWSPPISSAPGPGKILFLPENGDAYCKRMASNQISPESIRREEEAYRQAQLSSPTVTANKKIELF